MKKQIQELSAVVAQSHSVKGLELAKANEAIEQFIYSCSHALRGPLKSISGLVNLCKQQGNGSPDTGCKFMVRSIQVSVDKLEGILYDLEKFLTNSKQIVTSQAIDCNVEVGEIINSLQPLIQANNVKMKISIQQDAELHTDRNRLTVILANIIKNAVQYYDGQKKCSCVSIRVKVSASRCVFQIKDNGVGISLDVLPHIFELFYRGSEKSTGSGVGLYIVKEIVGKMAGKIKVKSVPGTGTTVMISIPNLTE